MSFNFRFFAKVFVWVLFRSKAPNVRVWLRRAVVLLASYALFITVETGNWTSFLLDNVLFPGYREQKIETPVFIIGNPRSGCRSSTVRAAPGPTPRNPTAAPCASPSRW